MRSKVLVSEVLSLLDVGDNSGEEISSEATYELPQFLSSTCLFCLQIKSMHVGSHSSDGTVSGLAVLLL